MTQPPVVPVSFFDQPQLPYLLIAGFCLLVALHFLKRALAPIGALVQAIASAALVALAIGAAFVLLAAAAFSR